jgi:hypothetical protein
MVFSNFPSKAPQILISLSADELASHSPFGLNLTAETAFVWPAKVNLRE